MVPDFFEWWHIPLIFLAGLVGEGYGSVVGGSSIVVQGIQVLLGAPPEAAIATDNAGGLAAEIGIASESKEDIIRQKSLILWMGIPLVLGGVIGVNLLLNLKPEVIENVLLAVLVCLILYSLFYKKSGSKESNHTKRNYVLLVSFSFLIGAYSNFISLGEGSFSRLLLISVMGLNVIETQGVKAMTLIPVRAYSLVATAFAGILIWPYLLTFFVSNFIAGKYATKLLRDIPEEYFKYLLIALSTLFALYLLLK